MGEEDENQAAAEDATNIVHAAFEALARDPGAKSASFRMVNGVVLHRNSTADVPTSGDGSAESVESEGVWSNSQYK